MNQDKRIIDCTMKELMQSIQEEIDKKFTNIIDNILSSSNKDTLTLEEALKFFGVSKKTLYNLRMNGDLPYFKIGKQIYIDKKEAIKFSMEKMNQLKN